jgi:hypothetical protein
MRDDNYTIHVPYEQYGVYDGLLAPDLRERERERERETDENDKVEARASIPGYVVTGPSPV